MIGLVTEVHGCTRSRNGWTCLGCLSMMALSARLASRAGPLQPTGPVLLSHFSKLIDSTDPADCLVSPQARLRHSPLPGSRLASSERPRRFPTTPEFNRIWTPSAARPGAQTLLATLRAKLSRL